MCIQEPYRIQTRPSSTLDSPNKITHMAHMFRVNSTALLQARPFLMYDDLSTKINLMEHSIILLLENIYMP